MKKFNLLFTIAIISLVTIFRAEAQDYVGTGDDVQYYKKVRYGLTSGLVGVNENGRVKYKDEEVDAFRKDGHIYEKMPVFKNNKETGSYAFMELVGYRNEMKVFRNYCADKLQDEFLVYRNGNFVVQFNERNSQTLNDFFFSSRKLYAGK